MATAKSIMFEFTSPAIGAFPILFDAVKYKDEKGVESKDANFSIRFLFKPDHPDIPAIRAGLLQAAQEAWPGVDLNALNHPIDWCLKDGNFLADRAKLKQKDHEHFRGWLVMNASTGEKYPPGLGAVVNGALKDVPRSGDEREAWRKYFFGGMSCLGQVAFKGFQVGNNAQTVKAYLQVLVSLGGTPDAKLQGGSGKSATSVFKGIVGHTTMANPITGGAVAGLPV